MPAAVWADLLQEKLRYLAQPQQERRGNHHFQNALIQISDPVTAADAIEMQLRGHNTMKDTQSKRKAESGL